MALAVTDETPRVHIARGTGASVPAGDGWLTPAERTVAHRLVVAKRIADWRLGRWLAKQAVAASLGREVEPARIQILARSDGSPDAEWLGAGADRGLSVSISHSEGTGFAAAAAAPVNLGCDVEMVAPRSERFVADYFTPTERNVFDAVATSRRDLAVNLAWGAKEAALKYLREGMRLDTRSVEVGLSQALFACPPGSEVPGELSVRTAGGDTLTCCWWVESKFVWTVVGRAPFVVVREREVPGR